MEKRLVSFFVATLIVLVGYQMLQRAVIGPPKPRAVVQVDDEQQPEDDQPPEAGIREDEPPVAEARREIDADEPPEGRAEAERVKAELDDDAEERKPAVPKQMITLGSLDPASGFSMLIYISNQGACIERIELNDPRYRDLDDRWGYLGHLALTDAPSGGCRVNVVGPGTPASAAVSSDGSIGLRGPTIQENDQGIQTVKHQGDRITAINGKAVATSVEFYQQLSRTKVGDEIELTVFRLDGSDTEQELRFTATLMRVPLAVMATEPNHPTEMDAPHPSSYLMTLDRLGDSKTKFGQDELGDLPSLHHSNWSVTTIPNGVELVYLLTPAELTAAGTSGRVEVVKRFQLARSPAGESLEAATSSGYLIDFDIECRNLGSEPLRLGYQLDGPTGMTTEGWWYSYKVHPSRFVGAGARDVIWRALGAKHELVTNSQITKQAQKATESSENPESPLFAESEPEALQYVGCDTQYFASVLKVAENGDPEAAELASASARAVGPLDKRLKRTDVTFRVKSKAVEIPAGQALQHSFDIFTGPKDAQLLSRYGLQECIVYGWFGSVSRPMLKLLHGLYWVTGSFSYGIAIILLTVLVRACMFPLGRKMALNAQKMQELAPEMKRIAEKYKNDMEKRGQAQRELFAKHKYNPFSGCLVMFIQMPIFLGLYRGLSCDIELRQAPLIPGMSWCSNLAGPDQFFHWEGIVPEFISSPYGLLGLGPYLNILPLITVGLFLMQHKLFTPPPQDEQQEMQHTVMKFMMAFMGILFHKVASGLCLYLITSTLWGLAERTMLPKPKLANQSAEPTLAKATVAGQGATSSNGATSKKKRLRKKKNKRR